MQTLKKTALTFLSVCMALFTHAQYISQLYDFDSTTDNGQTILQNSDGSFHIWGSVFQPHTSTESIGRMHISADGSQLFSKQIFDFGSHKYVTFPGTVKRIDSNNYFSCINYDPTSEFIVGFVRFNQNGDTTLFKLYPDTVLFKDLANDCIKIDKNKFFIASSIRGKGTNSTSYAKLRCVDSNGEELWNRVFSPPLFGTDAVISKLELLANGKVLGSAYCNYNAKLYPPVGGDYDLGISAPWFMIFDTAGNIVRDTVYADTAYHYIGGSYSIADKNGGYFHVGYLDSFVTSNPLNSQNIPYYVAHLDTNFRFTWRTNLADSLHKYVIWSALQLRDSNYLVIGSDFGIQGWMSKISKTGKVLWSHIYPLNSNNNGTLYDAIELSNGHIAATGSHANSVIQPWLNDVWLLEVDSNGCEVPGCSSGLGVPALPKQQEAFSVYPNPTTGSFTAEAAEAGILYLYNVQGQAVSQDHLSAGKTTLHMPDVATGIYTGRFVSEKSGDVHIVRVLYQH